MAASEENLVSLLSQLNSQPPPSHGKIASLLSTAKRALLSLNTLLPTPSTSPRLLSLARAILETGALLSIRLHQPEAFIRYFQQLLPFYELTPDSFEDDSRSQRNKITGLYLLLLLTKGDYAGFHTVLEGLEVEGMSDGLEAEGEAVGDKYILYPVKLERWLMEGSYDQVWGATKREGVPSEEFGVFSEVLVGTIRSEIASCSEKAYPSLPITNAKNLLFLESEGSVIEFAKERGWVIKDGHIYFPLQQDDGDVDEVLVASGQVIENTIGYARELETIV